MKIIGSLILITLFSCGSNNEFESTKKIKSTLTYRIDQDGNKSLEHLSEFDLLGNVIYEEDYMGGEIYGYRWHTYDSLNNKLESKFASCLDCEPTITRYHYESGKLIKKINNEYSSQLIYDDLGDCIQEIEVFNENNHLRRFKFMTYENHLLQAKTSYDVSKLNIPYSDYIIDSLINQDYPYYHYFENTFDDNGKIVKSEWFGSVSEWFEVQYHYYDENGFATKVDYSSRNGKNGGQRLYEYTYWD